MRKKYVAKRKEVCAGELMLSGQMTFKICDANGNEVTTEELAKVGITNFRVSGGLICRGMLFSVNENNLANDLVYTTPTNYQIDGLQPKIDIESKFIIDHYVELEELLKYLKYGEDLTQTDLNKIHRKLIVSKFWLNHNRELFDMRKPLIDGCWSGGGGCDTIPLPNEIYDCLDSIVGYRGGKPHEEEPGIEFIKKRKSNIIF